MIDLLRTFGNKPEHRPAGGLLAAIGPFFTFPIETTHRNLAESIGGVKSMDDAPMPRLRVAFQLRDRSHREECTAKEGGRKVIQRERAREEGGSREGFVSTLTKLNGVA